MDKILFKILLICFCISYCSCDSIENKNANKDACDDFASIKAEIDALKNKIDEQKLEFDEKLENQRDAYEEKLKNVVQMIRTDDSKIDTDDFLKSGDIEDDVLQNAQDIEQLRIDVIQQEFIINQVNKDTNTRKGERNKMATLNSLAYETPVGYADIQYDSADIQESTSGLGGVETGRVAAETRPTNIKIVWIIRIF